MMKLYLPYINLSTADLSLNTTVSSGSFYNILITGIIFRFYIKNKCNTITNIFTFRLINADGLFFDKMLTFHTTKMKH